MHNQSNTPNTQLWICELNCVEKIDVLFLQIPSATTVH